MAIGKFQRKTRQRQVILEELLKLNSHPTATELYEIVRKRLPKISLGTVYRNLELLSQSGAIGKLEIGGREARFDGDLEQHHHVRCIYCGRVDDLKGLPVHPVGNKLKEPNGWEILSYRLDFVGVCPECKGTHKKGM
jgi:Fur family ferric uptake transcriptional regulator